MCFVSVASISIKNLIVRLCSETWKRRLQLIPGKGERERDARLTYETQRLTAVAPLKKAVFY